MSAGPSKKLTVPDGVPAADETVAASVTAFPTCAGFGVAPSAVALGAAATVSASEALVLGL